MQGSLSNLAGVSGGTGVRVAKEGLRALSMEKLLLTPRTWLEGVNSSCPDSPGLWVFFFFKQLAPLLLHTSFSEDLLLKLEFLDTGVLSPPTQKDQP